MKTTEPSIASTRCQYRTPTGRQCCTPAGPGSTLCVRHAAAQSPDTVDFSAQLIDGCGDFQRAQHINYSFIRLYKLVAQGRISPRRAAVLAYIGSFILRSLRDIDYDNDHLAHDEENVAPKIAPHAQPEVVPAKQIGPGLKPLPATAAEFAAQVLATAAPDHNGGKE